MRQRSIITREEAVHLARKLRGRLLRERIPVHRVVLYGSVAKGKQHEWSDIDIAVICDPFRETRHEENMEMRKVRRDIDIRISPYALHPDDFRNRLFGLAREVERTGVEVEVEESVKVWYNKGKENPLPLPMLQRILAAAFTLLSLVFLGMVSARYIQGQIVEAQGGERALP